MLRLRGADVTRRRRLSIVEHDDLTKQVFRLLRAASRSRGGESSRRGVRSDGNAKSASHRQYPSMPGLVPGAQVQCTALGCICDRPGSEGRLEPSRAQMRSAAPGRIPE